MDGKNKTALGASPSQHDCFVETARILGCDEDEASFTEKLKVIASHKPAPKPAVNKPPKKPRSEV